MRVLFIGGTGIISTACTDLAISRGIELTLLNRGRRIGAIPAGARRVTADIDDFAEVSVEGWLRERFPRPEGRGMSASVGE